MKIIDITPFAQFAPLYAVALAALALLTVLQRWRMRPRYTARKLLTPTEHEFYHALADAVKGKYQIFAKVRLADIVEANHRRHFWRVAAKHLDFVLFDPRRNAVVAAIELDDRTHRRRDARKRDQIKNLALAQAGIPLVRIKAARRYDPRAIARKLSEIKDF